MAALHYGMTPHTAVGAPGLYSRLAIGRRGPDRDCIDRSQLVGLGVALIIDWDGRMGSERE